MPRQKKNSEMNETETKVSKKQNEKKVEATPVAKEEPPKKRTKSVKEKKKNVENEVTTESTSSSKLTEKEPVGTPSVPTEVCRAGEGVCEVVKQEAMSVVLERVGHEGVDSTD